MKVAQERLACVSVPERRGRKVNYEQLGIVRPRSALYTVAPGVIAFCLCFGIVFGSLPLRLPMIAPQTAEAAEMPETVIVSVCSTDELAGFIANGLDQIDAQAEELPETNRTVEADSDMAVVDEAEVSPAAETAEADTAEIIPAYSEDDVEKLATLIYCEAGNQCYEGQVAVGNVVLNRVESSAFPNDIESVIRQASATTYQFTPVGNGIYDHMLGSGHVPESCYNAARDAMNGVSYVEDCFFFRNPKIAGAHEGITIQDHVFW